MKNTNESDDWRVPCELASREKDPEKLVELVIDSNDYQPELNIETVEPPKGSTPPAVNIDS